ncbi:molybdenum cofactor biosynthesis protein B [Nevskia soli]|uniref:molybdenum cofactor biosynthesis protein B n=1 Tax=Nevskia soli TaxID=418856 RepID=UPI00068F2A43|nr:molybdenum cofactor biosynthesis protein B [Nevskia soli]
MMIAVLTVSDSRTLEDDKSGNLLQEKIQDSGHRMSVRSLVKDDRFVIRAFVSSWLISEEVDAIIVTGGTGLTGRDLSPEAIRPLLERTIDGFGELFRTLSYEDIGPSAMQSRALAGTANGRLVFCLPGSRGACELAWDRLIGPQLDTMTRPCNLAELLPRLRESADRPALPRVPSRRD